MQRLAAIVGFALWVFAPVVLVAGAGEAGASTPQYGSVRVDIEPEQARNAGAQWRLNHGPDTGWKDSGATIHNIRAAEPERPEAAISGTFAPHTQGYFTDFRIQYSVTGVLAESSPGDDVGQTTAWRRIRLTNVAPGATSVRISGSAGGADLGGSSQYSGRLTVELHVADKSETYDVVLPTGSSGPYPFDLSLPLPAGAGAHQVRFSIRTGMLWPNGFFAINLVSDTPRPPFDGVYTIMYRPIAGWTTPANQSVTVLPEAMVIRQGSYLEPGNRPPTVSLTYTPAHPTPQDQMLFTAAATDPDGDPLTYTWYVNGQLSMATSDTVRWTNPPEGTFTVRVVVSDGRGGTAEDQVTFLVAPLQIDLSVHDGQVFTQGDDFPVGVLVTRGDTEAVAGAAVTLKVYSPSGRLAGSAQLVTEEDGQAEWRGFFTADAAVGIWRIEAEAKTSTANASITREFEVIRLVVSSAQVQRNIEAIAQEWFAAPQVPNGVDRPFIARLWWPKGPKVNLREWRDSRFQPYTCSAQAIKTLLVLNSIRFSVQKERRLLMGGVDYGPVTDGTGLIHVAVALYPHGQHWLSGYILEPWFNQKKEVWSATIWSRAFVTDRAPDAVTRWLGISPWAGEYPTTASDGGYYPTTTDEVPPSLRGTNRTRVLTYSPALVLVVDGEGRQVGRLPDGTVVNEIAGAEQAHVDNEDGTYVNLISVPDGEYEVTITGTGDGTFHLVIGTDTEMVHYGEQSIRTGEQAALALASEALGEELILPDGGRIAAEPGLPEDPFLPEECAGDCNGDRQVTVDELLRGVNIALGTAALDTCPPFDWSGDGTVTIDELLLAVNHSLLGCLALPPTPTPTATRTVTTTITTATIAPSPTRTTAATATRTLTPTAPAPTHTATATPTVWLATATPTPTGAAVAYCSAPDSPIEIPDNDPLGIVSSIVVEESRNIEELVVTLWIEHAWVGDLVVSLTRMRDLLTVPLIDRPGHPASAFGCSGADVFCELTDSALLTAEDECAHPPPALQGALQPAGSLAIFDGDDLAGSWTLEVADLAPGDGGRLIQWCLQAGGSQD